MNGRDARRLIAVSPAINVCEEKRQTDAGCQKWHMKYGRGRKSRIKEFGPRGTVLVERQSLTAYNIRAFHSSEQ